MCRSTTPKRPAGQRPEPLRNPGAGFALATGQVTFSGTMIPPFMFSPFGIQYGGSYSGNLGANGAGMWPRRRFVAVSVDALLCNDQHPPAATDTCFLCLCVLVQTPAQAYMSRLFFMLGTLILVGILLYPS